MDTSTDHYRGGAYSHTTTSTSNQSRFENRPTQVGVDHIQHQTIAVVYEYAENRRMTMRRPYWARTGDLVYVVCSRGVEHHVYDLYCPAKDEWAVLQADGVEPLSVRLPLMAGAVGLFAQIQVLNGPRTLALAVVSAVATYAAMAMRRRWHAFLLARSRARGRAETMNLIRRDGDERDDIRRRIMARF